MKEAINAAEAAEVFKNELEGKVKSLKADLAVINKEVWVLKVDREKTACTLAELQTSVSTKNQELTKANDVIEKIP